MIKRSCFFTKEQSLALRGIAIIMVVLSHYIVWFSDVVENEQLRLTISKFGIYGVSIFFLVSGYGLVKSVSRRKIGFGFFWNRVKNTYLPFLLIAGLIELYAGGIHTPEAWYKYLTGYDFWFIRNILIFYIAFYVIYRLADKSSIRMLLLAAFTAGYSWWLFDIGRANFWYVSNMAFVLGAVLAQYEKKLLKAAGFLYPLQMALLIGLFYIMSKNGMQHAPGKLELPEDALNGALTCLVWAVLCAQTAVLFAGRQALLLIPGRMSLEIYISHTFIYIRVLNSFLEKGPLFIGLLSIGATIAVSFLVNWLFSLLWRAVDSAGPKKGSVYRNKG